MLAAASVSAAAIEVPPASAAAQVADPITAEYQFDRETFRIDGSNSVLHFGGLVSGLYLAFRPTVPAASELTIRVLSSLRVGNSTFTAASGFAVSVSPATATPTEFFVPTAFTAGRSVLVIESDTSWTVCNTCIDSPASYRVSLRSGQAAALVDAEQLAVFTQGVVGLPPSFVQLDRMLKSNDAAVAAGNTVPFATPQLQTELARAAAALKASVARTPATVDELRTQFVQLVAPGVHLSDVSGRTELYGLQVAAVVEELKTLATQKKNAFKNKMVADAAGPANRAATEEDYRRVSKGAADLSGLDQLSLDGDKSGGVFGAMTSTVIPNLVADAFKPDGFLSRLPLNDFGSVGPDDDPLVVNGDFCAAARATSDVLAHGAAFGVDSELAEKLRPIRARMFRLFDEQFGKPPRPETLRARQGEVRAFQRCNDAFDAAHPDRELKKQADEAGEALRKAGGDGPCLLVAHAYDLRGKRNAKSPLDRKTGVLAIVSPGNVARLSAVPYGSNVRVDGVAVQDRSSAGVGLEKRSYSGQLIWRAVRYQDDRLYVEIFSISNDSLLRAQTIRVNPDVCYRIEFGPALPAGPSAGSSTPASPPAAKKPPAPSPKATTTTTTSSTTTTTTVTTTTTTTTTRPPRVAVNVPPRAPSPPPPVSPQPPAQPPVVGSCAAPAVATFALRLQAGAAQCGIELDGTTIGSSDNAKALVTKWNRQLLSMAGQIADANDHDPVVDPILNAVTREGSQLVRLYPQVSRELTIEEESALVAWFDRAFDAYKVAESELLRISQRRAALVQQETKTKLEREVADTKRLLQEKKRQAFRTGDTRVLVQLADGLSKIEGFFGELDSRTAQYEQAKAAIDRTRIAPVLSSAPFRFGDRAAELAKTFSPLGEYAGALATKATEVDNVVRFLLPLGDGRSEFDDFNQSLEKLALATSFGVSQLEAILPGSLVLLASVSELDAVIANASALLDQLAEAEVTGVNRLNFERGTWSGVNWSVEPGGRALATYMSNVRSTTSLARQQPLPTSLKAYFENNRAAFNAGLFMPMPGTTTLGFNFRITSIDAFDAWMFENKVDIWEKLYGSRRNPTRII